MYWMLLPLRRYAQFSGRSRRKEFWMFVLGTIVFTILYLLIAGNLFVDAGPGDEEMGSAYAVEVTASDPLIFPLMLVLLIPSLAVQVRRFHDQDKTGWLVLLNLVPFLGFFIIVAFMCIEGTRGPNRYGPDPKAPDHDEIFA
ncbi:MAG: DUF805 domain-containing protein [Allosphingosinicella sp.]|uniref:DUF805 domain-containing protein n=1 Tax=Allosphingosinicella sp. TaxID=2823234 RepID=UPI003926D05F